MMFIPLAAGIPTMNQCHPARDASGLHPLLAEYVHGVSGVLDAGNPGSTPKMVAELVPPLFEADDLLRPDQRISDPECYKRHLLYAEPQGRFTLLALIWLPGQQTPVHGHNAWCVVGVLEGAIGVTTYSRDNPHLADCRALSTSGDFTVSAGTVSFARPDPEGIHRLTNASAKAVVTLHTYGMNLFDEPTAINKLYA